MTDRETELNELAEEAEKMVASLAELKNNIASFNKAEKEIRIVSEKLGELIDQSSGQVEKASQILANTAGIDVETLVKWLHAIYEQTKKIDAGVKSVSEQVASASDANQQQFPPIGQSLSNLKSEIEEVRKELQENAVAFSQAVTTSTHESKKTLTPIVPMLETFKSDFVRFRQEVKEETVKSQRAAKKQTILLGVAVILSIVGIAIGIAL